MTTQLAPLMRDQRKADAEHLRILSLCHFIMAGLTVAGLGLLFFHWFMMHQFLESPSAWGGAPNAPSPREAWNVFRWFYLIFGTFTIVAGTANASSGWLIRNRRGRVFSLVVAGLNCMGLPFGTTLGVFTFVVLLRESVAELYAAAAVERASPAPGTPP